MKKFIAEMRVYKQTLSFNKKNNSELIARLIYCSVTCAYRCAMGKKAFELCGSCEVIIQNFVI